MRPETLRTARLTLEPLTPEHADELGPLLHDVRLHTFTGGTPMSTEELRARFTRQLAHDGAPCGECWCNWVLRRTRDGVAVGLVQATVRTEPPPPVAALAWTVGVAHQRQGYAREAAAAVVQALRAHGVVALSAHIHPAHAASGAVAAAIGLVATDERVQGEVVWVSSASRAHSLG